MVLPSIAALKHVAGSYLTDSCRLDAAAATASGAASRPSGTSYACYVYGEGPGAGMGGEVWQTGEDQSVTVYLHHSCPVKPGDNLVSTALSKTFNVQTVSPKETHGAIVVATAVQTSPTPGPGS